MKSIFIATMAVTISLASFSNSTHAQDKGFGKTPITLGTSPKFIWTNWTKAPQSLKDATKLIITERGETLYKFIQKVLTDEDATNPEVDIALIDLNNDGVLGIGVQLRSRTWCGSAGCTYEMYENAGIIYVALNDYDLKPAVYGVRSSAKKFFGMEANKHCQYKGIRDTPAIFNQSKI